MNASSPAAAGRATTFPMKRKIAAILAADVAGYSRLVAEDEERTLTEFAAARDVFDALVARSGGRIFNTAGDSVMCEFDSAVEAVRAAVDIQEAMRSRNLGLEPGRRLEFRMGLTIGDVVERGGDLLGDGVNIAARLEGLAPPGGICVSRSVHEAVANKLSVSFRELGARQVKNMPQPLHAYLIAPPGAGPADEEPLVARPDRTPSGRSPSSRGARTARRFAIAGAVLAGVFVGVPALKVVRATIESLAPETRTAPPEPDKPPANEAATPPRNAAAPSAAPVPSNTPPPRPVRPEARPADARAPSVTRPAPKEGPREPGTPEPPRPDAAKTAARPADPAAAYASLAREGVVADARTLPELYHNARALEVKGDRTAALAAYGAAVPLAGEAVDVHLRHASLLRAAKGVGAVRQVYGALARTGPTVAGGMVLALSAEGDERRARIEALSAAHPDAAVVDYVLSEALAESRDGGPTLTERRLAFDATDRFLDAAASGALDGRFVDRAFLDGWLDGARKRRGEIEAAFAGAATRPGATFQRTATGWIARLSLPEPASAIAVRIGDRGEFVPTGFARTADARTGKPAPVAEVELPSNTGRTTLYVSYRDRAGREAGPFPLPFDPAAATAESGRSALERYPESWVAFRSDIPDLLSYAGLVSNRCALAQATIGYGDETPRETLPLPPCDATGPTAMPAGTALVRLPSGTESVQVQLTYADGSESQVRTFRRP